MTLDIVIIIDGMDRPLPNDRQSLKNQFHTQISNINSMINEISSKPNQINLGVLWIGSHFVKLFADMVSTKHSINMINRRLINKEIEPFTNHRNLIIAEAYSLAASMMISNDIKANRSSVPNVVLFFTSGIFDFSLFSRMRQDALRLMADSHLITVPIGNFYDEKTLLNFVSCPEYLQKFRNIEFLLEKLSNLCTTA